jgi:pimeloyl-ACP methyl ester carboxylesterase
LVLAFQTVADVIALDQRGAGLSSPCLTCPPDEIRLPLDRPLDLKQFQQAYLAVSRRCARFWTDRGVHLSAYNTEESADDLESLRLALGAPKIVLYGGSYGTHLGLAAIRRHREHIDRAILAGVEGPDQTWKLPSAIETHFAELSRLSGDSATAHDLLPLMRRVLARLDREPVAVRVPSEKGDSTEVVIGGLDARVADQYFLGDLDNIRNVFAIYTTMDRGDFSLLGRLALRLRTVSVGFAMYYCMDCASGATAGRLERIREEAALPLSLVGPALNAPFPEVCEAWPYRDLGDEFRGPLQSDVPVLFVSGSLDGQTPIQNVSELFAGFTRADHPIVENAAHQYLDLAHPDIRRIMVDFLSGRPPHPLVVTAPAVRFLSE